MVLLNTDLIGLSAVEAGFAAAGAAVLATFLLAVVAGVAVGAAGFLAAAATVFDAGEAFLAAETGLVVLFAVAGDFFAVAMVCIVVQSCEEYVRREKERSRQVPCSRECVALLSAIRL